MDAPQARFPDDEAGDFQLPLLGLYADMESARGSVCLPDEFHQHDARWRLSLLDDWIHGLDQLRRTARAEIDPPPQYPPV